MKSLMFFLLLGYTIILNAQEESRLLRFPAIYGDNIVFSYAGDLYTVSANGGTARKLTTHIGMELFPRFSPDGKYIAFTGQYDGNTEVYLIPSNGGVPKRLTYTATLGRDDVSDRMGPNNIVMAWRDNNTIVYRSRRIEFNDFKGQLFEVSVTGGLSKQLPLPRGGFCSFSPDGNRMVYNRIFREFRTWKRYKGGMADDVWLYDFKTKKTENLTNNPAQDFIPMWIGNKVFFLSERDGRANLYSYDFTSKETKKVTSFTEFDCKFPSAGKDVIVFENGGYIYKLDAVTGKYEKVKIIISDDFSSGRDGLTDVSKNVSNYEISPDGKRALFGARGDVFTVPAKDGVTRNLTKSPGVHERNSKWSPDGKYIAYISDESGEDEIYIVAQDGSSKPKQITSGSKNYKYQILWSPDSKKIMWADRNQKLYYVDIESKKVTEVAYSEVWEFNQYSWSPDSKWITYAYPENENITRVMVYSLIEKKSWPVTDSWYSSGGPEFSDDGKYLYFVSNRTFNPSYGWLEWNHIYVDMAKVYLVTLTKDTKSPFEPKSDETAIKDTSAKETKKEEKGKEVNVVIDLDGITDRIVEVTPTAANYWGIQTAGEKVYYLKMSSKDTQPSLMMFDLSSRKETDCGNVNGFEISADKKKMLVSQQMSFAIIDLPSGKVEPKEKLNLSDMKVHLDRKAEWKQIFNETWRQMRDFFYDPDMHKVDWEQVRKTYAPLVEHVNHRTDLTYIIGEMIAELNIGHAYVGGGDYPKAERIKQGLLGAQLEKDTKSGYFRIAKILKGANWDKSLRSPLTEIGVNVNEGDYIIAVDGVETNTLNDIYESLVNRVGKQVTLTVNGKPQKEGSRQTVVLPIDDEQNLYYYKWVTENIEKVNKATNGEVGYIHIPDMGVDGLNQFARLYYPQLRKKGLIIDVRGNGGGNVSPMIMERLQRQLTMIEVARNTIHSADPSGMHVGPKVALIDEFSASDGDIFSYRFKFNKIGKTIGKRTWGGVVGIRGTLPLLDGGYLNKPEFSRYDVNGKEWIMEGYGVDPDIVVDNDPALEYEGIDQQLNRAIEEIKNELKNYKPLPPPPPYPDKSK